MDKLKKAIQSDGFFLCLKCNEICVFKENHIATDMIYDIMVSKKERGYFLCGFITD